MVSREEQILTRQLTKAKPPPVLYRYRRPIDSTLRELATPEVHVTAVDDMNDPFEYRAPLSIDPEKLRTAFSIYAQRELGMSPEAAKKETDTIGEIEADHVRRKFDAIRTASGVICTSSDPRSTRMWSYYGDSHRGVCIGYSSAAPPFRLARAVSYVDPEGPLDLLDALERDPSLLSDHISCRKGAEWSFEQEYRVPLGPISSGRSRLLPVAPAAVLEIRFGVRIDPGFKAKVLAVMNSRLPHVRVFQMGCDHQSFRLTEAEYVRDA